LPPPDCCHRVARDLDKQGRCLDPWGNAYHIVADWNGDGKVVVGSIVISNPVAVWSDGPNRKNELGKGDDICSWK
jgi:hypothetical protein